MNKQFETTNSLPPKVKKTIEEFQKSEEHLELPEDEPDLEPPYDSQKFVSKPFLSPYCTLPGNIIEFDYSYGYDCRKLFNLCVVDSDVLIYASGNLIHFYDTTTKKKWYRRCYSGCGIGHITKNPKHPHIAVGEKGVNPLIIIYAWPSFDIVTILKKGTKTAFTFLNYSPDGEFLCSQGNHPDYMLTIWDWKKSRIMLKSKAYDKTVFNSGFSLYVPGQLTTSGIGHIKFWKITKTFTGLKLLGEPGRFGKSEICNVVGFLALPDERVLSGCEWGNILVWDEGLIRVEVFRRGRNFCHEAPITQFIYRDGDLMTVAMDGTIKVWFYETIELADPPEEDKSIEIEPVFEYEIHNDHHKAKLLSIVEADPDNPEDFFWYGQDASGGIWKLELSLSLSAKSPALIFQCHAGSVIAVQSSPFSTHLASLGEDGKLFIYDYEKKITMLQKEFSADGCSLLWLPLEVEGSGCVLIGGFTDGAIRVMCVRLHEFTRNLPSPTGEYINLIQKWKPHTKAVTVVTINPQHTIIVTGSEDCTIFIFEIRERQQYPVLVPIGFAPVPGEVSHCTWKPEADATILVSCKNGSFVEIELPSKAPSIDPVSFLLNEVNLKKQKFVSIKSQIKQNLKLEEIKARRQAQLEEKKKELRIKKEETGISIDEAAILEAFREELESKEPDLPDLYIPEIPSPILFAVYTKEKIWLSMGNYDAGYLYEYNFQNGLVRYKAIPEEAEISTYHYYHNNKYLILGTKDGKVWVVKVNPEAEMDLNDYWSLSMHDNDNGRIKQICFSYDYSYMFTCGNDGNVFSYKFNAEDKTKKNVKIDVQQKNFALEIIPDINETTSLSLEQIKNAIERDQIMKEAETYKKNLMNVLEDLEKKYEALLNRNSKLPKSQQLTAQELVLDERLVDDVNKDLESKMHLVKLKMARDLEKSKIQHSKVLKYFINPIETHSLKVFDIDNKDVNVKTFRLRKLPLEFENIQTQILVRLQKQEAKDKWVESMLAEVRPEAKVVMEEEIVEKITIQPNPVEVLLKQIMILCGDYKKNIKLRRLLRKYRERRHRLESRRIEWHEMMKQKPSPEKLDPEDIANIEVAKNNIGDYQLKTSADYKVPKEARITTVHVYDELLKTRQKIQSIKKNYNEKVLQLRKRKLDMIERHKFLREILKEIEKEIPRDKVKHPPSLPTYVNDIEYPENKFSQSQVPDEIPESLKNIYRPDESENSDLNLLDKEYEMSIFEKINESLQFHTKHGITGSCNFKELQEAGADDEIPTSWEKTFKELRVIKRLYEQTHIIEEMESVIRRFDEDVINLKEIKYRTEVDIKFLELHLLILHQEVFILKKFEAAEEEKESELLQKLKEKHEIQEKMNKMDSKIKERNKIIQAWEKDIKNIESTFQAETEQNPYHNFLSKIFMKKYKPPKVKSEDSDPEFESESCSSEDTSDDSTDDSMNFDETKCPPGCNEQILAWALTERSNRHHLELSVAEERKKMDIYLTEYEMLSKKIKQVEEQCLNYKTDLEKLTKEKQRNLNEVETFIVLSLSQIQSFKSENEIEDLTNCVVISSSGLKHLYKRVGELERETVIERQKYEKNRQHLTKMKIDVDHKKEMRSKLIKEIDEAMIKKFGMKVDIDDIEEAILEKLVSEMHKVVMDLENELEKNQRAIREELIEKENEYAKNIQDNTERFTLLTMLQQEKAKIQESIKRQKKTTGRNKEDEETEEKALENLRSVKKMQEGKITELKREIAGLKLKVKPKLPETFDKITECDFEEITYELRDMLEEAQEIAEDMREGGITREDTERMRKLTADMIQMLPERFKVGAIKRLSRGLLKEEVLTKRCPQRLLLDIVNAFKMESFLEAMQIVKETIEAMISSFEDKVFGTHPK